MVPTAPIKYQYYQSAECLNISILAKGLLPTEVIYRHYLPFFYLSIVSSFTCSLLACYLFTRSYAGVLFSNLLIYRVVCLTNECVLYMLVVMFTSPSSLLIFPFLFSLPIISTHLLSCSLLHVLDVPIISPTPHFSTHLLPSSSPLFFYSTHH